MPSATVGTLRVLLSANTAEFETAMAKASDSVKAWQGTMRGIGDAATSAGKIMTAAFTVPLTAIGVGAVKAAMDFETAFANVAKTVDGVADSTGKLTPKGEALAKTFREMAKEIPATTEELTKIAALGGQMGVSADKLQVFTKHVAALGVAVDGISTEEAAKGLAQIGNIAGTGTRDIANMASALVHLGNNSNATEADILELTKRLMGAGTTVGMTTQDVMALGTSMANVGINAEAGGTAMSTVISKISQAVSEGGAALDDFAKVANRSAEEFAATWRRSPIEAMQLFITGLGDMKARGVDLNMTMGEIGTEGIRVADTLKRLAGNGKDVGDMLRVSNEGFAAANKHLEEAEKKYATTANQVKILWNQIKDLGIELGAAFLPLMKSAVQTVSAFVPVIEMAVRAFTAMPQPVQMIVIAIGGLVAAIGPLLIVFGSVMRNAADIITIFGKKGLATRTLGIDFGSLAGASGKLSTALGVLSKAAGVAAAAFVGWQVGRLIADLTGLDQKIANSITNLEALTRTRQMAVQGAQGQANVTAELTKLEAQYAEAVRNGEKALAGSIQRQIEAIKNDQTRMAIQDTINKAIKEGADANINYANAVKFLEQKHIENANAVGFWAKAQKEAEQGINSTLGATTNATKATQTFTQELTKARTELANMSQGDLADLTLAIKHHGGSVEELAKRYGVSELAVKVLSDRMKEGAKATKDATSELEKQEAALSKLGIVTDSSVNRTLKELTDLEKLATSAGADHNVVLASMLPLLQELHNKAVMSGAGVDQTTAALQRAKIAAQELTDAYLRLIPTIPIEPLTELPGTVVAVDKAFADNKFHTDSLAEAYKHFGITSRAELQKTAAESVYNYQVISQSGTATAEEIKAAFDKMQKDVKAASGEVPSFWETNVVPRLKDAYETITKSLADNLARMMTGMSSFAEGFKGIWESIKQSLLNILSSILHSFIDGFLQSMFKSAIKWAGDTTTGVDGILTPGFGSILGKIGGLFQGAMQGFGSLMIGGFRSIIGAVGGVMTGGFSGILSAMSGMLTSWIGIAIAAVAGIVALFSNAFRGGEEGTQVNPARNAFLAQFGPAGTGPGSGFWELGVQLEAAVGSAMAEQLHAALRAADTMAEFNAAVARIQQALGGGGFAPLSGTSFGGDTVGPGEIAPEIAPFIPENFSATRFASGGVELMAEGGFGRVDRPTLFIAGEEGPEDFAFSGANRSFSQDTPTELHAHFHGPVFAEREYIRDVILPELNSAWRTNYRNSMTGTQAVLEIKRGIGGG